MPPDGKAVRFAIESQYDPFPAAAMARVHKITDVAVAGRFHCDDGSYGFHHRIRIALGYVRRPDFASVRHRHVAPGRRAGGLDGQQTSRRRPAVRWEAMRFRLRRFRVAGRSSALRSAEGPGDRAHVGVIAPCRDPSVPDLEDSRDRKVNLTAVLA